MRTLTLCQACKHHIKVSETQCPFCGAALLLPRPQPALRARGFSGGRAALFLAGTALVPGCAEEPEPEVLKQDAGASDAGTAAHDAGKDAGNMTVVPVYGVAIDPRRDAGFMPVPPYGIAIPTDAGAPDSGALDAGCPQVGRLPVPVYGVAVDSGTPRDVCTDAGQDAGRDAGRDAGPLAVPVYGIAIDRDR